MAEPAHVILRVRCAHCHGAVELECEGLQGFWGHPTYNEYFCPHCRKQNHQLSSGAVVSARVPVDDDLETVRGALGRRRNAQKNAESIATWEGEGGAVKPPSDEER